MLCQTLLTPLCWKNAYFNWFFPKCTSSLKRYECFFLIAYQYQCSYSHLVKILFIVYRSHQHLHNCHRKYLQFKFNLIDCEVVTLFTFETNQTQLTKGLNTGIINSRGSSDDLRVLQVKVHIEITI